ncbi:Formin-binding protein 1-like protein, partial [Fragariocoptes setiger]
WSEELWDQFDNISNHTSKGVEFLDRFGQFIKDRCMIELEYATKLRKLVKNHDLKKKDEGELEFTYCRAFKQMLREIVDMAGQHELVAENMSLQIVKEINILSKELKNEHKMYLNEGLRLQANLNNSLNQLDKSKKSYDKAFKESEKAHENFQKADADRNLSRAEVERSRAISMAKEQQCEDYKTEYAKQLQTANNCQREHYHHLMPKVFEQLQDIEVKRIDCAQNFIKLSAIVQRNVAPIIDKCLQGIIDSADSIDTKSDCQLVIDRYKSGMQPPDDIPFEDLSNPRSPEQVESTYHRGSTLGYSQSLKSDSLRHTLSARGLKKRTKLFGLFGYNKGKTDDPQQDYADLPPNQKRKKILARVSELQSQINQENAVREGLMTMRQAYSENGAFGDPMTIESKLQENQASLKRLMNELEKFQSLLSELNCNTPPSNGDNSNMTLPGKPNLKHRNSSETESLSGTNSEHSLRPDSVHHEHTKSNATTRTSNSFNDSTSDSISNHATGDADSEVVSEKQYEIDPDDMPSQGNAKALYNFKAEPEGSISMSEGEEFDIIEVDQGDGWTRVRRKTYGPGDQEYTGFVPTSYLEIHLATTDMTNGHK